MLTFLVPYSSRTTAPSGGISWCNGTGRLKRVGGEGVQRRQQGIFSWGQGDLVVVTTSSIPLVARW